MNKHKTALIASVLFLAGIFIPSAGQASLVGTEAQATLSLSPATGSYSPNDTFTVSILMDTKGQNVVVSGAYLLYDPNSFQAVSIDTTGSVYTMGVEKTIDASTGTIKITRGIPTPGVNTANGLVAKVNFKALYGTSPSLDNLTFRFIAGNSNASSVIKDDGLGTNILSGVHGAKYTVTGQSNPSPVSVTPPPIPVSSGGGSSDKTPPGQVKKLAAQSTETQVLLTWENPTDGDYAKTKILRKENSYSASYADGTMVFDDNKNSFTDSGVKSGTTYYYSVYTYDTNNNYSLASQITIITKGTPPVGGNSNYPDSTLLKTADSPKVYVIIQGKKKWISTPEVFETLGYKWTAITITDSNTLKSIVDFEDNLIRAIGDYKVYMVVNGIRHHVPNPEIFLDYGFAWEDVKDVPSETIAKYQLVRLIRESRQGKIYYLSAAGVKKWIPNPQIFASYNNKWEDIQVISKKEMDSYLVSNLMSYNNQVYLIQGTTKRLIPNETILKKYNTSLMLNANKTEFNWYKLGSNVK